jgi:hypothetical protein
MKRTLRVFGNALGNCLYDRSYLTNIGRMANPQVGMIYSHARKNGLLFKYMIQIKFNPGDLYRHEQMMEKIKKEEEELNKKNQANQGQQVKQQSQNNNNNNTNQSYRNNQTNQPNHQSFNRNNQPNHNNNNNNNNNQSYQNKQPNTVNQMIQLKKEQQHIPAQVIESTTATVTPAKDSKPESSKKPGLRSPFAQPLIHEDSFCYGKLL